MKNLLELFNEMQSGCFSITRLWLSDKGYLFNTINVPNIGTFPSGHNYIEKYYMPEFKNKRKEVKNILEIGIQNGGSLSLWKKWFTEATVWGIENDKNKFNVIPILITPFFPEIKETDFKFIYGDAYSEKIINILPDNYFDYIIDDGDHEIESQIVFIKKYLKKLKSGGKLIIEDIRYYYKDGLEWHPDVKKLNRMNELIDAIDKDQLENYKIFDLRDERTNSLTSLHQWWLNDDVILEITKK